MQFTEGKNGSEPTAPVVSERNLGDACADMRVDHQGLRCGYPDMTGGQMPPKAKKKHVAGQKKSGRRAMKMPVERLDKNFCRHDRHASSRVGRHLFRFRTNHITPYAPQKTKAIASNMTQGGLMLVGRTDPGSRSRDDFAALDAHLKKLPPSMALSREPG